MTRTCRSFEERIAESSSVTFTRRNWLSVPVAVFTSAFLSPLTEPRSVAPPEQSELESTSHGVPEVSLAELVIAGTIAGIAGAFVATRALEALLYGVQPTDPVTFAGVGLLLVAVAALESWPATRRAARLDPLEALRAE